MAFSTKHGESGRNITKEYRTWKGIKTRIFNARDDDYRNYGHRGIQMCKRWIDSFENFLSDVGRAPSPKHSIDRKNNHGDYEPGNVRWSTVKQQSRNTRRTKLNPFLAESIRQLRSENMMPRTICEYLNVELSDVCHVLYSKQWLGV